VPGTPRLGTGRAGAGWMGREEGTIVPREGAEVGLGRGVGGSREFSCSLFISFHLAVQNLAIPKWRF
jgi:hypothetical protein